MSSLGSYASKMLLNFNSYMITLDPFYWWSLPISIALIFVYKLFRPCFPIKVNCWFCRTNQIVPYSKRLSFSCCVTSCGQYNGFTADGDYDKIIEEQYCEQGHPSSPEHSFSMRNHQKHAQGALCNECNLRQQKKLEKLACFAPTKEKYFEAEYKAYSRRLEQIYELCDSCFQRTSKLLQGQDEYLRNMYFRKERSNMNGPTTPQVGMFSHVPLSVNERRRSSLQRRIDGDPSLSPNRFPNSSFYGNRGKVQEKNSLSLKILRAALQITNLLTSLIVLFYMVCECCSLKVLVASWLAHHPRLDDLIRILFDHIVCFYLLGIVTQYFVTLSYKRCRNHLGGLMLWIVASLLAYNSTSLCTVEQPQMVSLVLVLTAVSNSFMSAICLCLKFCQSSRNYAENFHATSGKLFGSEQRMTNSNNFKVSKSNSQAGGNSFKNDEMFAAMKLSASQQSDYIKPTQTNKDSFLFFDHKVRLDEFKVRLRASQGLPRPLISPPRFSPRTEHHNSGFDSQELFVKHAKN